MGGQLSAWAISDTDRIAVTRFAGFKGGQGATMGLYHRENGAWKPSPVRVIGDGAIGRLKDFSWCNELMEGKVENLFLQEQLMAFNKYVETGYITYAEAKHHLQHSINLMDRPVTFYHVLTEEAPPGGMQHLGASPDMEFKIGVSGPGVTEFKGNVSGSLYTVSGQTFELTAAGDQPEIKHFELPWMRDPDFADALKEKFSRQKYPLIWELGRAATTDVHELAHMMSMAGQDIANEVMHIGIPNPEYLKQAYVSMFFLSQENTDKFYKMFGKYLFTSAKKNPGKTVFIVPLMEYLEKFPPRRYDSAHKRLFEQKLYRSPAEGFQLLETLKYFHHQVLDMRYRGKNLKTPIFFSAAAATDLMVPMELLLTQHFKLPAESLAQLKGTNNQISVRGGSLDIPWPEKLLDPAASHALQGVWDGMPLQIANLDPELAARDPYYVPAVLSGIFDHYMRQFGGDKGIDAEKIQAIAKALKEAQVHFVVSTQYPKTAQVLRSLKPKSEKTVDLAPDAHTRVVWDQLEKDSGGKLKRPSKSLYTFSFDLDQLSVARGMTYLASGQDYRNMPFIRPGVHWWMQGVSEP